MHPQLLIHSVIEETMILVAHLATAGGVRAPLAHVANQVFADLTEQLAAQGVKKTVIADMFGWMGIGVLGTLWALSCATTSSQKSTGTNWLACTTDADCAADAGQSCHAEGVCVNASGVPVTTTGSAVTSKNRESRTPAVHHASSLTCPAERAAGTGEGHACPMSDPMGDLSKCQRDSDCTSGVNGRCLAFGGPACLTGCSYDTCTTDADCPSHQVCDCRGSGSSSDANVCVPADCRDDADCGPGGFCSPSVPRDDCSCYSASFCTPDSGSNCSGGQCLCGDSCEHAYTCHTPNDTCLDDSDCTGNGPCAYDLGEKRWACQASCIGPI